MTERGTREMETPFLKLLATLAIPKKVQRTIQENLLSVEVYAETRQVLLRFIAAETLEGKWLKVLAEALNRKFPQQATFQTITVNTNPLFWQKNLEKRWPQLLEALGLEFPFLQGCLGVISYSIGDGNQICLTLPSPFLRKLLEEKLGQLEGFISRFLATKIQIRLEVVAQGLEEKWQRAKKEREQEDRKYVAQLQQAGGREEKGELPLILMGKQISAPPTPLSGLTTTTGDLVISGEVIKWEYRKIRAGRLLFTLVLSDRLDSLAVKTVCDGERGESIKRACQREGIWFLVRGSLEEDRYLREEVLWAKDITLIPGQYRRDEGTENRVELHLHTQMSALDATVRVDELFATLNRWGHEAVAITDHGVIQAFPEAYIQGKKYGIKVLYGLEGYLVDEGREREKAFHVILLAKNQQGLKDLYRLISLSHLQHFYRVPRILRKDLIRHRDNLLVGSACQAGELIQAYLKGSSGEELAQIARFYDYLELQPWANNSFLIREGRVKKEELLDMNEKLYRLGKGLGLPVVATGDVHFLEPEDDLLRSILMTGQGFNDADHQAPLYLKTTGEMLAEFAHLGEDVAREVVIENTQRIAAEIEDVQPLPHGLHAPVIPGADEQIRTYAFSEAKKLYGEPLPQLVVQRLEKELAAIIDNGYAVIYLIAHKLVAKSLRDGYLVGSRGSVGSSFVATMCGITEVNPLPPHYRCPKCNYNDFITDASVGSGFDLPQRSCPHCGCKLAADGHNIPFEVFMGYEGDKVPDIDLNFSGEYQPTIHRYTEEFFGSERVFRAGTISTTAERTAYGFVKGYFSEKGIKRRSVEIDRLVKACTGIKRTTGQHPGGLMILPADKEIEEFTPLQYPADAKSAGVITTHFDYNSLGGCLLKLDLLGHDDPTALKILSELTGVDADTIPYNDEETMAIFSGLGEMGLEPDLFDIPIGTIGIPEFGTRFVRQMLYDTKPTTFAELVRISGLSHGTDVWLQNAQDLVRSGTAELSEVISTRDDIMTYLIAYGVPHRRAFNIMEQVRRGKGLDKEDIRVMSAAGIPQWYIDSCQRIKYMFPKAHAVAYVIMAYRIAWYKVHYPQAFYATYYTLRAGEFDVSWALGGLASIRRQISEIEKKGNGATVRERSRLTLLEVALEMYARGFKFRGIDLDKSDSRRFIITPTGLLPPFSALTGVGQTAAKNIVQARREGAFTSVEDLRTRARLSKKVIESLREMGCLNALPETNQLLLFAE